MTATMTTVNAILKEVYEGQIQTQMSDEVVALKRIERTSAGVVDTVGGKYVTFPIRVRRNAGISYRAENVALAAPGRQGYAAVQIGLKYGYGRFEVTGQTMELAESNYQAFASAMDGEMDGIKRDLAKDEARITYGNVSNGAMTFINDTATSASHVVLSVQYLTIGDVVDVLIASTGSATGGGTALTIDNIVESTLTVTFSASIGPTATTMAIYRTGNRLLEPTGFQQMMNTGILYGIDPAAQPLWVSTRNAIGGVLTELQMIAACDTARRKGGKTSVIFTSLGVRRAYFNLLTQQRRFVQTKEFTGGFQGLAFNYGSEIPVVEDVDCPAGHMFFVDESRVKKYRKREWYFADDDGNVLKWVKDFDKWEGLAKQYWELGTSQRNAHVVNTGITES